CSPRLRGGGERFIVRYPVTHEGRRHAMWVGEGESFLIPGPKVDQGTSGAVREPLAMSFGRGAGAPWGIYDDIGVFPTLSRTLTSLPRTISPVRCARRALDRSG